jgi:hypothetical protein
MAFKKLSPDCRRSLRWRCSESLLCVLTTSHSTQRLTTTEREVSGEGDFPGNGTSRGPIPRPKSLLHEAASVSPLTPPKDRGVPETLTSLETILTSHDLFHHDIGRLNDCADVDHWVLSPPKCGTYGLWKSLCSSGLPAFHLHQDQNLWSCFPCLREVPRRSIGILDLLNYRRSRTSRQLVLYFGVRDPISWSLSLADELFASTDSHFLSSAPRHIKSSPYREYWLTETKQIIDRYLGRDMLQTGFDRVNGFTVIDDHRTRLVLYRLDAIEKLYRYVEEQFGVRRGDDTRRNGNPAYLRACRTVRLSSREIMECLRLPLVQDFFTKKQLQLILRRWWWWTRWLNQQTNRLQRLADRVGLGHQRIWGPVSGS